MMTHLLAIGGIFAIMLGGIAVERLYRRFAASNPELGPFRDTSKCGSCSSGSGCGDAGRDARGADEPSVPRR